MECIVDKPPLRLPVGVRTASTITTSRTLGTLLPRSYDSQPSQGRTDVIRTGRLGEAEFAVVPRNDSVNMHLYHHTLVEHRLDVGVDGRCVGARVPFPEADAQRP